MTFLNPLYLIALAAAAIPIVLHLLNLRRTRVIEFSTLAFLRELQKSKIRRLKIRQWILLVLRTLIVVCIVLAFARPAFRGTVGGLLGTHAKTSAVIILDDSFSMLSSDRRGQLFKQAKTSAKAILDLLQPGDEAALIRVSEAGVKKTEFTAALNALRDEIERSQPSFAHHVLADALTEAHILLDRTRNFNREIYLITDEQRSHFLAKDRPEPLKLFDDRFRVFLMPLGEDRPQNTALVDVRVQNALFEVNKPVEVAATILNFGPRHLQNEVTSLYIDGERVAQKTVDVDPGGRKEVEFTAMPKRTGFIDGFVELEDDMLPEDNRRYFSFHVPDRISILLSADHPGDALFLDAALAASTGAILSITPITSGQLSAVNLKRYDVVILLAGSALPAGAGAKLAAYVKEGGGVYLLPAGAGDAGTGMDGILRAIGLPPTQGVNGSTTDKTASSQFGKIDFAHPLFAGMFLRSDPGKAPQVESPGIHAFLRLPQAEGLQSIIATSAGLPFLAEARPGGGKVLVCAVAPRLDWSDFPLKGLFVPLLNRAMFYLASRDFNSAGRMVGEPFEIQYSGAPEGSSVYTLVSPSRAETRIIPKTLASGLSFPVPGLAAPGNYTLSRNGDPVRIVPVNIDPEESDLTRLSGEQRSSFWSALGVHPRVLGPGTDILREVSQTRYGLELWKYFLGAAILFAILEMLIARDPKRAEVEPAAA